MKYFVKSIILMLSIIFLFRDTICMDNNCCELYQKYCNVSRKFLINSYKICNKSVEKLFKLYNDVYVQNNNTNYININRLTRRSRIYLFNKIIRNEFILFKQHDNNYINSIQMRPIYFQYKTLFVAIYLTIKKDKTGNINQPGNIFVEFSNKEDQYWSAKTWQEIVNSNNNLEYEIMLDLEVARRFVDGDKFYDLPIAALLPYLTENKTSCQDFITNDESLFKGQNRIQCAKAIINIIEQGNEPCTEEKIRNSMSCLHIDNPDEDSRINT